MEFSAVIDKLDDVLSSAKKVRLSSDVRVHKEEISAIVAQLRGAIPEELEQAHWIAEHREEMLAEASRETTRILEEAREERARLLGREDIASAAEQRAQQLLDDATALEREIRLAAEDYADDILSNLETYLVKLAEGADRGRARLVERGGDPVAGREAALAA